jgi:heat shock protein HslJ
MTRRPVLLLLVLLGACGALRTSDWDRAVETSWRLAALESEPALEGVAVTLDLEGDDRVFGHGGVNRYFGSCVRDGKGSFRTSGLASTRMAGPVDATAQESRYLELLDRADALAIDGEELVLSEDGRELLRFRPAR